MKICEIKKDLFNNTSLTDFGVRFEIFDREMKEKKKSELSKQLPGNHDIKLDNINFLYVFNVSKEGVNINSRGFSRLNFLQLEEITRVIKILRGDKMESDFTELENQKKQLEEALILIYKEFNNEKNGNKPLCIECDAPNDCLCINNIAITTLEKIKQEPIKEILEA